MNRKSKLSLLAGLLAAVMWQAHAQIPVLGGRPPDVDQLLRQATLMNKEVTVAVQVKQDGRVIAQAKHNASMNKPLSECFGRRIVYPADLKVSKRRDCEGIYVGFSPTGFAENVIEAAYRVEYYKIDGYSADVDPRLPILRGFEISTPRAVFVPNEPLISTQGKYEIEVTASY